MYKILVLFSISLLGLAGFYAPNSIYSSSNQAKSIPKLGKIVKKTGDEGFDLAKQQSQLFWLSGGHQGMLLFESGNLVISSDGNILDGNLTLDMASIQSTDFQPEEGSQELENYLKSKDFLAVDVFPKAQFSIKKASPLCKVNDFTNANKVMVVGVGELTIKGVSQIVSFTATTSRKQGTIKVQAELNFDYTRWGIKTSKFSKSENGIMVNEIKINLNLIFTAGC